MYGFRLVAKPFAWVDEEEGGILGLLGGVYAGLGLAWLTDFDDPLVLATPNESIVFTTPDLEGDSGSYRHFEAGWAWGPVRLGWERVIGEASNVPIGGGEKEDMDQLGSWSLFASANLTGEAQVYRRGRWAEPEPPRSDGPLPGRLELAVRYSNADIDRALFDAERGITDYDPSTQEVRTFSLGLDWQPLRAVRLGFGWVKTIADHELTTFGGKNRDSTLTLRLELIL
jgi:phosphate-selective porin